MERELSLEELIAQHDEKIKDAQDNLGDVEVRDAILEKAETYLKFGSIEKAIETYETALAKSVGIGKKMDINFMIMKIHIKERDLNKIKSQIEKQQYLLDQGGDWERKNRLQVIILCIKILKNNLKVYEGIYCLMVRDIKKASQLLLDSVSTFNSQEVISYNELVYYTVLTNMITLDRLNLKNKVLHNPEVVGATRENVDLKYFLESFIKCDYRLLFKKFAVILEQLQTDQYLAIHRKYLTREFRVVFYSQFLESYKTVTLLNMANAFGVSVNFIDKELSDLISSRRLNCKIDKVSGIVESQRTDERNHLYQTALKQGDYLLNRIQKLSRITDQ